MRKRRERRWRKKRQKLKLDPGRHFSVLDLKDFRIRHVGGEGVLRQEQEQEPAGEGSYTWLVRFWL